MSQFAFRFKVIGAGLGLCALSLLTSTPARAVTLVEYNVGVLTDTFIPGQSFIIPAAGSYNNITFNFFSDVPATTPVAAGTLFLLTQEYLGDPNALSAATPGFVGSSTGISGGVYQFNSAVTLQGATNYFAYATASMTLTGANPGSYADGIVYSAAATNAPFAGDPVTDANFRVSGTVLAVTGPEPASLALLTLPVFAFVARRKVR